MQDQEHDPNRILRVFQTKTQTKSFYDRISTVYDVLAEGAEEPVRSAALDKLAARPGETVLEVGFGTGHSLKVMASAVGPHGCVIGLDLSEGMADRARATLANHSVLQSVGLVCGDGAQMPLRDAMVDAISMTFTLELFDTPEIPVVLAECRRVLKRSGRMVIASLAKDEHDLGSNVMEWTHLHFPNFANCRPIFVRRPVVSAGFVIHNVERARIWLPVDIVLATVR